MHQSIYFVVRVRCRRKESSRSLSHLLMSFLYIFVWLLPAGQPRIQWRRYTRAGWKIHRPGSSPAYCFALLILWTENKYVAISDRFICFILTVKRRWRLRKKVHPGCVLRATPKKRSSTILRRKVHTSDLAGEFSDPEMTWLLYCAGTATGHIQPW